MRNVWAKAILVLTCFIEQVGKYYKTQIRNKLDISKLQAVETKNLIRNWQQITNTACENLHIFRFFINVLIILHIDRMLTISNILKFTQAIAIPRICRNAGYILKSFGQHLTKYDLTAANVRLKTKQKNKK